jgi:hypothetical protein
LYRTMSRPNLAAARRECDAAVSRPILMFEGSAPPAVGCTSVTSATSATPDGRRHATREATVASALEQELPRGMRRPAGSLTKWLLTCTFAAGRYWLFPIGFGCLADFSRTRRGPAAAVPVGGSRPTPRPIGVSRTKRRPALACAPGADDGDHLRGSMAWIAHAGWRSGEGGGVS